MNKMKKNFLMFAALVATTVGFTACSSEDDLANAEQEERSVVKTEFSISFPQKVGTTRMSAATIQAQGQAFRGIRDIELYPFNVDSAGVINTSTTLDLPTPIKLYKGTTAGTTGSSSTADDNAIANGSLYSYTNAHLYQNVDINIGTKAFMFYGLADYTETSNVPKKYGSLIKTNNSKLGNIKFSLEPIYKTESVNAAGDSIAEYLTSIAEAKFVGTGSTDSLWSETPNVALKTLYNNFVTMKAGSFNNMKAAVEKIAKELSKTVVGDNGMTKKMKKAILDAITASKYGVTADTDGNLTFSSKLKSNSYPANIGLPDGAAYIDWQLKPNSTTEYEFKALLNNNNTGLNVASLNTYTYPASLYYYVLSNIKTSNLPMANVYSSLAVSGKTWDDVTKAYPASTSEYNSTVVSAETRSIAILRQVQYAVGRLDVTVKGDGTSLEDRKGKSHTLGSTSFPVTGILVHGFKAVDYKFQQKTDESTIYTVYDTVYYNKTTTTNNIYLSSGKSKEMHTLVLETKDAGETTTTGQADLVAKIAVEFLNNTTDTIYGINKERIYPGCKFYLAGTLDPVLNDGSEAPGHSNVKYQGTNELIKKAFVQDHTTTANLTIKSLSNAYNTLPDLALPELEMGLSVDLDWKTGISQNIDIQ